MFSINLDVKEEKRVVDTGDNAPLPPVSTALDFYSAKHRGKIEPFGHFVE